MAITFPAGREAPDFGQFVVNVGVDLSYCLESLPYNSGYTDPLGGDCVRVDNGQLVLCTSTSASGGSDASNVEGVLLFTDPVTHNGVYLARGPVGAKNYTLNSMDPDDVSAALAAYGILTSSEGTTWTI